MKLYNAMEESYLKENLIHKWVTNIVRQNDGSIPAPCGHGNIEPHQF